MRVTGCLPFEYSRADREPQLEMAGLERVRRPEMTRSMRRMLDVRQRQRRAARRMVSRAGRQRALYWMSENQTYTQE